MNNAVTDSAWTAYLRHGTREQHKRLDSHPALQALIRPDLTEQDYRNSLSLLASIWLPFGAHYHWAHRFSQALTQDCRHHQLIINPVTLPPTSTREAQLAWQYVMWGSIQGGAFLHRRLHSRGDLSLAFFGRCTQPLIFPDSIDRPAKDCLEPARQVFDFWIEQAAQHSPAKLMA